ncbi:hypothetical protein LWF15_24355 [Kineosporia rhizophila]|uniref:hypothetical protein n=1 Tax=Kineosporia rhizophila TaxID=84633 RepID=UPI001E4FECBB|nr:hypothetical protein [Kineosporia rhizophila]MCE0538636.1 hypothetical protein [Kineosporia rhizophila]
MRTDPRNSFSAAVCLALGSIAFAGSATHILHVGAYPHVDVTGWLVWSVAGSLEALAAYAAWEARQRRGWNRAIPALVLLASLAFIILANLAAAEDDTWAARLPWADAFAVVPPLSFLSVVAIAESRTWKMPSPPRPTRTPRPARAKVTSTEPDKPGPPVGPTPLASVSAVTSLKPVVRPGEGRSEAVERWLAEGQRWKAMIEAGMEAYGVGETAMKNEIRRARQAVRDEPQQASF